MGKEEIKIINEDEFNEFKSQLIGKTFIIHDPFYSPDSYFLITDLKLISGSRSILVGIIAYSCLKKIINTIDYFHKEQIEDLLKNKVCQIYNNAWYFIED